MTRFSLGFNQKQFNNHSNVDSRAVCLGSTRGKFSTNRIYNYYKRNG